MLTFETHAPEADLEVRECFSRTLAQCLPKKYVLLQTCNRVELYGDDGMESSPNDEKILRYLCEVTCGLRSHLIGETQIQQQVKAAYDAATRLGTVSSRLHFLFQQAIRIAKLVRTRTGISRGAMSHSQAACEVIRSYPIDLAEARITVIGVHALNRSFLYYLKKAGAKTVLIANRHYGKACQLAWEFDCMACGLDQISDILRQTDILVSATNAPHFVVTLDRFPVDKHMLILDLAVPRDIDPRIGDLPPVILLNLSDVEAQVLQNLDRRQQACEQARDLIGQELAALFKRRVLYVSPGY